MDSRDVGLELTEINGHTVIVEPNRIIHVIFRGDLRVEETKFIQSKVYELGDRYGSVACILDISKMAGFDSATRRTWVRVSRPFPIEIGCFYAGSFAIRTLVNTVFQAGVLLFPKFFQFEIRFAATEAEARAIVAAHRAKTAKP